VAAGRARAIGVLQGCNGTIVSLELGCMYVTTEPGSSVAALTLVDKHDGEQDRYRDDPGSVPADGATAIVLARGDGVVRVLATQVVGDGRFNGQPALDPAQFGDREAFRMELRRRLVSERRVMGEAKRDCVRAALDDADVKADEIGHWLMSYSGRFMLDRDFYAEFGIDDTRTTWAWGRTIGHIRGGDPVVGLTHLLETGAVKVGDRVAMLGDSSGFAFGCAVLEVARLPLWSTGDDHRVS
jgi:3-oxoacyl-[acyl-carrier-protein] synthase-3